MIDLVDVKIEMKQGVYQIVYVNKHELNGNFETVDKLVNGKEFHNINQILIYISSELGIDSELIQII